MTRSISFNKGTARAWLAQFWPRLDRAQALVTDYEMAVAQYPKVFADIALKCCAFNTTYVEGDAAESHALSRAREVWIHIQTMAKLTHEDLNHLEEETDQ